MYKKIAVLLLFISSSLFAQNSEIKGTILDEDNIPLMGANVFWQGTSIGTTSDENGKFTLKTSPDTKNLLVSYIGFKTQKIEVTSSTTLQIKLVALTTLNEVTVSKTVKSTMNSYTSSINLQTMGQKELLKAACCNLSESFSTNPSIDVNFSDAVTGNRQIKMLGLTNP